jgi:hypothetical protein
MVIAVTHGYNSMWTRREREPTTNFMPVVFEQFQFGSYGSKSPESEMKF